MKLEAKISLQESGGSRKVRMMEDDGAVSPSGGKPLRKCDLWRGVRDRQIEEARAVDLADYLRMYEPEELKKNGKYQYRTASHDSLVISNGK